MRLNPRLGYGMAALAAVISGISIWVNSLGVTAVIRDATLYTTLKNAVVAVIVLVTLLFVGRQRAELSRLRPRQAAWLAALAVVGGAVPYVLFFEGLRLTTATTGSLLNHLQFAAVAVLALVFLRERLAAPAWLAVGVLLVASFIGVNLHAVQFGRGALLVLASTILFAAGFTIAKHLLKDLSTQTVMTAKMAGGSVLLLLYSAFTGHLRPVSHLSAAQWEWVLMTGILLAAFTAAILLAIKHAPVTAVLAIGTAAPLITLALQSAAGRTPRMAAGAVLSLALTAAAALVVAAVGAWPQGRRAPA